MSVASGLLGQQRIAECVFCDRDRISSEVEYYNGVDGSVHMVFEPLDPVVPGHLLVVPERHTSDATEDRYVAAMAMSVASRVASRYPAANIITSIGTAATQSVFHLHLHVVPRRPGDGLPLPWTPQQTKEKGTW